MYIEEKLVNNEKTATKTKYLKLIFGNILILLASNIC